MPKSKRNKQVDLSKTKKHGLEGKKKLFEEVRSCVETYTHLFIFSVNDMRNSKIKSVRDQWKHSRFFIGKNKVMAKALGMGPEDEFRMNLHKIGCRLKGERGLFFSNQPIEEVSKWFSSYSEGDFARSGNRATETVVLQEGPLNQFPHNLEPYLRQLGLPTALKKGVIHLVKDHTVCNVGDTLTPETAKIVKLLGYEMAEFFIKIECVWSQDGSFSEFSTGEESKENMKQANLSLVSTQALNGSTSMDVDEVELEEPSDEMIENVIMKNRRSLMENKSKQLDNDASSNESSEDDETVEIDEFKSTNKNFSLEKSNELSGDKIKDIPVVLEDDTAIINSENTSDNDEVISEVVANNAESDNEGEIITSEVESKEVKMVPELIEDTKTSTNSDKDDESKVEEVPQAVDTKTSSNSDEDDDNKVEEVPQAVENESDEDEEIPELVPDASASKIANENTLKRLSLDKCVLQSPVMLEKRPKYSPKMTRSAMKAKKAVTKIEMVVQPKLSEDVEGEVVKEAQVRGRSHKRHSTGESPVERKLRNRSVKIVKKKK